MMVNDEEGRVCNAQGFLLDKDGNRIPIYVYPVEDKDGVDGVALLEQKITICRNWYKEEWGVDLDEIRNVVQNRLQSFNSSTLDMLRQQVYGIQ